MEQSHKASHTTKGSIFVDAAISIPLIIICVSLLLSIVIKINEEDNAYANLAESTIYLSSCMGLDESIDYLCVYGGTSTESICLFYRPFVSESKARDKSGDLVYIFEKSGKRYHTENCSTLTYNEDYSLILKDEAIKRGFTPCKLCIIDGGIDYFKKRK